MDKTIVIASGNKHKIREFSEIMQGYNIIPMSEVGFDMDIEEDGTTLEANALIKASTIREYLAKKGLDYPVIADDSGLFCDALNGAPGINSARYAGCHGDDEANRQKLLRDLDGKSSKDAYFGCIIIMLMQDGTYYIGDGKTYGRVLSEYRGSDGFGYDCLFYSYDLKKSFGQASAQEKNSVSHRRRALDDLMNNIANNRRRKIND